MSVGLYFDVHVRREVAEGLRRRGVDVLTAQEDGTTRLSDSEMLDRAGAIGRVLFTQDEGLLAESARRQRQGLDFITVIYAHQLSGLRHKSDDVRCAQFGLWRGARREHPPAVGL